MFGRGTLHAVAAICAVDRLRVRSLAIVVVAVVVAVVVIAASEGLLAVAMSTVGLVTALGESIRVVATDGGGIRGVALAHLVGGGVCGKSVGILLDVAVLLAAKTAEEATTLLSVAGGVVVAGGRTERLLLAAVADEDELHQGGEDEEENGDDGDGKDSGLHSTESTIGGQTVAVVILIALAEDSVDNAAAVAGTTTVRLGNKDERADKGNVEDNGEEGGRWVPGKAAKKKQCCSCVQHTDA